MRPHSWGPLDAWGEAHPGGGFSLDATAAARLRSDYLKKIKYEEKNATLSIQKMGPFGENNARSFRLAVRARLNSRAFNYFACLINYYLKYNLFVNHIISI